MGYLRASEVMMALGRHECGIPSGDILQAELGT